MATMDSTFVVAIVSPVDVAACWLEPAAVPNDITQSQMIDMTGQNLNYFLLAGRESRLVLANQILH